MNYIKQLEADNISLINGIKETYEQINQLRRYLNSEKFRCNNELDGYVNIKDVLSRLPLEY